jgi:hypothetical protein
VLPEGNSVSLRLGFQVREIGVDVGSFDFAPLRMTVKLEGWI